MSLANLKMESYEKIGTWLREVMEGYLDEFEKSGGRKPRAKASPKLANIAFALFIFTLGYLSGPSFFASLNRKSLRYGVFTAIECVSILAIAAVATVLLKLDVGTAAGMLAGGATESAVVGTATDAIGKLAAPADQIAAWQSNVGTAYSISYIMGLITIVLLSSQIFPSIMKVNLRDEADRLWRKLGAAPALPELVGRAHQVSVASGQSVEQLETAFGQGTTVERVDRGGKVLEFAAVTKLAKGDIVLLVGRREVLLRAGNLVGPEVAPSNGMDVELDQMEAVLTTKGAAGQTIGALREQILITLVPACLSLLVASKVMKLEAPLALGAVAGQQCSTPAITAVQSAAGNTTPLMSYTVVYALSNVVLPLLGPIVVAMAHSLR